MNESQRSVRRLLRAIRLSWCLSAVSTGIIVVTGMLSAWLLGAVLLDNLFLLPSAVRWVCLVAGVSLAVGVLWHALLADIPLFAGDERVAAYFERRVPQADNRLINSVQLAGGETLESCSLPMAVRFVEQSVHHLRQFSGWESFEGERLTKCLKWSAGPLVAIVLYAGCFWTPFSGAVYRLVHPASTMNTVSGLRISVTPGDATVVEGGELEVLARIDGGTAKAAFLEYEVQASPDPVRVAMTVRTPDDGPSDYVAVMRDITAPRRYRVVAEPERDKQMMFALRALRRRPAVSRGYAVDTVPPPRIEHLRFASDFPDYTGLADAVDEGSDGDMKVPEGTVVGIRARCNKPISSAVLRMREEETPLHVEGPDVEASFTVNSSTSYSFALTDEEGYRNADPIVYTVVALPDRAPEVRITAPDRDLSVDAPGDSPSATIPMAFESKDDYGLNEVHVYLKRGVEEEARILETLLDTRGEDAPRIREGALDVDLAKLEPKVGPGDLIQLWLEAVDNRPEEPNRGRSRTLNIRIEGGDAEEELQSTEDDDTAIDADDTQEMTLEDEPGKPLEDEAARDQIEERLKSFADMQREAIEQTNNLSPRDREDLTGEEKEEFKDVAAAEDDLAEFLEELISDLSELPSQDFSKPSLVDEIVEILAEVELAEDALEVENKLMAIAAEQVGLELAEELIHDLPSWLSDLPDKLKWDLEEPLEPYEAPMAELPEELTDMMGDLIDAEAAMTDEVEDESSSWADSLDAGAGWMAMDGPISNMSAKGITGNLLPNSSEIGGRSGEGRTGRTHGEFVEKTAVGKGGRDTPTRLTPDPFEQGIVEDSSTDPMGGATGGGKLSGSGGEGLPGPVPPDVQHAMNRLAGRQADIRAKAERLEFKLKVVNVPAPGLKDAIGMMKEIEEDLRDFRYQNVLQKKDILLQTMHESQGSMTKQIRIRGERSTRLPEEAQQEILEALDEEVLPEYEDLVADYFKAVAGSG